eukprot:936675-Pelagomonas_calceolata.AAC.8
MHEVSTEASTSCLRICKILTTRSFKNAILLLDSAPFFLTQNASLHVTTKGIVFCALCRVVATAYYSCALGLARKHDHLVAKLLAHICIKLSNILVLMGVSGSVQTIVLDATFRLSQLVAVHLRWFKCKEYCQTTLHDKGVCAPA